jgi:hypothetical protein
VADQIASEFEKNGIDKNALFKKLENMNSLRATLFAEKRVSVQFLARLMNDNKLPNLKLTEEESKRLVDALVDPLVDRCDPDGRNCLADLINGNK